MRKIVSTFNKLLIVGMMAGVSLGTAAPCALSNSLLQAVATGGAYTITGTGSCSFTASGLPDWIAVTGSTAGSVTLYIAGNGGAARSVPITVAGITYTIEQQAAAVSLPGLSLVGSMPHLASAGTWETTFTLVNNGTSSATARTNFFADDGTALNLPLTFPQTPAALTTAASFDRTLAPNASLILDSTAPDSQAVQVGSAQLLSTDKVSGFAIFKYKVAGQEAVVPLETRNAPSYVLAFDNTNSAALGVALQNVSASPASVRVFIHDEFGFQIGADTVVLPAYGHTSFVLPTQYPATANRRGSIEFDTPQGGQISALGIRFTPPGTLTTIPVLANVTNAGGSVAHIAVAGGWKTTIVLVNTGPTSAQAHLRFFDDNGAPLVLPLAFPPSTSAANVTQLDRAISGFGSLTVESAGLDTSPVQTGSIQLAADGKIGGYVIFRYTPNGQEASTPFENRGASAYIIPFDHTGSVVTGTAVNNASAQAVNIPWILRDDAGNQIGNGSLPLAANGHTAFSLAGQFPVTANIRGTIEFDTPAGAQINVLGIRTPPTLTFTTLPALTK